MAPPTSFDPDEFPDSPHAQELRGGRVRLGFESGLEAAFDRHWLQQVRPRVRVFAVITVALAGIFSFEKLARDGAMSLSALLHFGLLIPTTLALLWLVLGRHYARLYTRAAQWIAPLLAALACVLAAQSIARGATEDLAVAALTMPAVFFFMGLKFRTAIAAGTIALGAFVSGGLLFGIDPGLFTKGILLVASAGLIAAFISRDVEQGLRMQFLEDALIQELVERDPLTGLKNRRAFDEHLLRMWQQCMRDRRRLGLLFIDIDDFKAYNDAYGHQAGDAALRQVAGVLREYARRPLDIAARLGGEEFCVVLYDAPPDHVVDFGERLLEAVRSLRIAHRRSRCADVLTISIGVALVEPAIGRTPAGAVQLADEALYAAKEAGRNRSVVYGSEEYASLDTGVYNRSRKRRGSS